MRAALYTRVSTSSQNTCRQFAELEAKAKQKEWSIVKRVSEVVSGAKPYTARNGFKEILSQIEKGSIDVVVVHEISRLGRNTVDVLKCIQELNTAEVSVYIMNIDITVKPDRADPSANLIVAVLASLATHERELMQQRIISGIKASSKTSGRRKGESYTLDDYKKKYPIVVKLLSDHYNLKMISELTGISYRTIQRINKLND